MRNQLKTTHTAFNDGNSHAKGGFHLSMVNPISSNFHVDDKPQSLLIWGLADGETVEILRVREGSTGKTTWGGNECCSNNSPDLTVNMDTMPYRQCGKPVMIYACNPHFVLRDVGLFCLKYNGTGDVFVEKRDDLIFLKKEDCLC